MNKEDFYRKYIPALEKALDLNCICEDVYVNGPEKFYNQSERVKKEMDIYLDNNSGKDEFLDMVGYYFHSKSHGFKEIKGESINSFKKKIKKKLLLFKKKYKL